jgi:hypothetical protein
MQRSRGWHWIPAVPPRHCARGPNSVLPSAGRCATLRTSRGNSPPAVSPSGSSAPRTMQRRGRRSSASHRARPATSAATPVSTKPSTFSTRARIVVSNDSGLMHVAAALRKPLVALYGSSRSPSTPPPSRATRAILRLDLPCSPCFKRECPLGALQGMVDLAPERVLAAIDSTGALAAGGRSRSGKKTRTALESGTTLEYPRVSQNPGVKKALFPTPQDAETGVLRRPHQVRSGSHDGGVGR